MFDTIINTWVALSTNNILFGIVKFFSVVILVLFTVYFGIVRLLEYLYKKFNSQGFEAYKEEQRNRSMTLADYDEKFGGSQPQHQQQNHHQVQQQQSQQLNPQTYSQAQNQQQAQHHMNNNTIQEHTQQDQNQQQPQQGPQDIQPAQPYNLRDRDEMTSTLSQLTERLRNNVNPGVAPQPNRLPPEEEDIMERIRNRINS